MKATANFHFDGQFYPAGKEVPKEVQGQVGKHLFASVSAPEPSPAPTPQVDPVTTPEGEPEPSQGEPGDGEGSTKDEEYFSGLNKEQLVAEAKEAGITGKATKEELITKLVEHHG